MENLSAIPLKNVVDENKIFFPLFNSLLVDLTVRCFEAISSSETRRTSKTPCLNSGLKASKEFQLF